jgi:hypothetical protein
LFDLLLDFLREVDAHLVELLADLVKLGCGYFLRLKQLGNVQDCFFDLVRFAALHLDQLLRDHFGQHVGVLLE